MRIATSIYCVEEALGDLFEKLLSEYSAAVGKEIDRERLGWHWVLQEIDIPMPKSAAVLLKSDPMQHLAIGLSRGKYELRLNAKPETGKVWLSAVLSGAIAPKEVAMALKKRATPNVGSKWGGTMVEIYMPMHQKHPGIAEHAIVGGIRRSSGEVLCFISDRPDPIIAPLWHIFSFHPAKRCAKALLSVVDREGQRDFRGTLTGQELVLRDFQGDKLNEQEILDSLSGVKKYMWSTQLPSSVCVIPNNARKFKLGEELSAQECKSMPAEALICALDAMMAKGSDKRL